MALKFLNKKGWHTGSLRNIENVWKAEQKHDAEQKKLEELQKQIREEQEKQDFRKLQEQAGLVPKQERLDFMYESGLGYGKPSTDEYLLGKPVEEKEQNVVEQVASAPGSLFVEEKISANDAWRKIRTDPLLLIKQQELAARDRIRNNPVKMEMLRKEVELKKNKKEEKKRLKSEKKRKLKELKKKEKSHEADDGNGKSSHSEESRKKDGEEHDSRDESTSPSPRPCKRGRHDDENTHDKRRHYGEGESSRQYEESRKSRPNRSHEDNRERDREEWRRRRDREEGRRSPRRDRSEGERRKDGSLHRDHEGERRTVKDEGHGSPERDYVGEKRKDEGRRSPRTDREGGRRKDEGHRSPQRENERRTDRSLQEEPVGSGGRQEEKQVSDGDRVGKLPPPLQEEKQRVGSYGKPPLPRKRQLSEEEKMARLQEMQQDAELHEEQRWQRLNKASINDAIQEKKDSIRSANNFLDKTNRSVYGTENSQSASIAETLHRKSHYREKFTDTNAFKRG